MRAQGSVAEIVLGDVKKAVEVVVAVLVAFGLAGIRRLVATEIKRLSVATEIKSVSVMGVGVAAEMMSVSVPFSPRAVSVAIVAVKVVTIVSTVLVAVVAETGRAALNVVFVTESLTL